MKDNHWLEQCAKRFLELGCPMPIATEYASVALEPLMECEGTGDDVSSYRCVEECDV